MASRFKRPRVQPPQPSPATASVYDEDDYLSAAFVTEQPKAPGVPGADKSKRGKRLADPERGRVLSQKDIAKKMVDRREEGLEQKIGENNTGFKLLMKLGYKGGGLGKDGAGTARPIAPEIKQGRAGLGKESETKRKKEESKKRTQERANREAQHEVERREHFRLAKAAQFVDRRLQQDLSRARRLVESLDEQDGRPRSIMWPEEDDDTLENAVSELPGGRLAESWETGKGDRTIASTTLAVVVSSGSGGDLGSETEGEGLGPGGGLREEWDMMTPEEKLSACLAYLRACHCYCMYCACKYSRSSDLRESCPGPNRDDHDDEEL